MVIAANIVRGVFALFSLGLALSFTMPAAAMAATVTSIDPNSLITALQDAGYRAKLSKTDEGDPQIETADGGNSILIYFAECKNHLACEQIELIAFWACKDKVKECKTQSEAWNSQENFAHTATVEESVFIYSYLLFDKQGISSDLFLQNVAYFSRDARNFEGQFK